MKKIVFIFSCIALTWACGNKSQAPATSEATQESQAKPLAEAQYFGEKITADGAINVSELKAQMGDKKEMKAKVIAPVEAVCQKKGCWMDLTTASGEEPIRVTFKDYAFFMPKDASGREAIVEGTAKVEETSVADLKEYAKDAGKSKDEIAAITQPKKELVFEADGVILR